MVSKGNHPKMAELFRLVKYYNFPRKHQIYHLVMTNSLPWKDPPFLSSVNPGKPSISMGHLYHGYVSHNQRVSQPDGKFSMNKLMLLQEPKKKWPS